MDKDRLRLLLIRDTIYDAHKLVEISPTDFDLIKAVWLADLAVELMLATVVTDFKLLNKNAYGFEDLVKAVKDANEPSKIDELKPQLISVDELHKRRNRVHAGVSYSAMSSRQSVGFADAFIRTAFEKVYHLKLDELSLLSFLEDVEAKQRLQMAVHCVESADYYNGAFNAAVAFELARDIVSNQIDLWSRHIDMGSPLRHIRTQIGNKSVTSHISGFQSESPHQVKQMAFVLELTRFGIVPGETLDFLASSMLVSRPSSVEDEWRPVQIEFGYRYGKDWSKDEVARQISFVTEVLYRIQQSTIAR